MQIYKKQVKAALDSLRDTLIGLGANPYRIDLPRPTGVMKVGVDDFLVKKGRKAAKAFGELERHSLFLAEGITGSALMKNKYEGPRWVIPGLITEGLTILAGKPKAGKSFFVLSLVLAVASGKLAFGHFEVAKGKACYLSLEDTAVRIQGRMIDLGASGADVENASFFFEWPSVEEGGLLALERWLSRNPDCRVVFIDTFAKVRRRLRNAPTYYDDYSAASALKKIADHFRIGIVVVHHTRKESADDIFDSISGTRGISGSADSNIVLTRDRNGIDGFLHITGRDIQEQMLAGTFTNGAWTIIGEAGPVLATKTQTEILMLLIETGDAMTPTAIARATGRKAGGLSKTLAKMVNDGLLEKLEGGKYIPKEAAKKGPSKFAKRPSKNDGCES